MDQTVSTCSLDVFQNYLPFIPNEATLKASIEVLTRTGTNGDSILVKFGIGRYRLKRFSSKHRARDKNTREGLLFVEKACARLKECNIPGRALTHQYVDCLNTTMLSDARVSTRKIDGAIIPVGRLEVDGIQNEGVYTSEVAVAFEIKDEDDASEAGTEESASKVVTAIVQIMNDDARRMFSYGITVAGITLKVWYFSRSYTLICEEIDVFEHPEKVVMILISFMFATKAEMGYDSHVIRRGPTQYVYEIGNRFFRTHELISGYRSRSVTGRMLRVWAAREVESNEENASYIGEDECVVKDVWLDVDARPESEIQEALFHDIEEFWQTTPSDDKAGLRNLWNKHRSLVTSGSYKDYFLTHIVAQVGQKTKPYKGTSCGGNGLNPAVASRKQYRVVLKERCKTIIRHLPTLGHAVDILGQTLVPLQLMLCAGWVHRDISSGNILAYEKPNGLLKAKLSDLEYARKFPRSDGKVAGDPKTGTPYFMAVEVQDLLYLADAPEDSETPSKFQRTSKSQVFETQSVVIHNFQHDLEPIWWILFWFITKRVDHRPSLLYGETIFSHSMEVSRERRAALTKPLHLESVLKESLSTFVEDMESMRKALFRHYKRRDRLAKLNNPCEYTVIHEIFEQFFNLLMDDKDSIWASEPLIQSNGYTEAPGSATSNVTDATDELEEELSEHAEQLDEPLLSLSAPQRRIRPTVPRNPIITRSTGSLLESQSLVHDNDESGRRSSKCLKSKK